MRHLNRVCEVVFAASFLTGCTAASIPANIAATAIPQHERATNQTLYAFSPETSLVAAYSNSSSTPAELESVLEGSKTRLTIGNGMAVDADGTMYVAIQASGPHGTHMQLLVFAPGSAGNTAPKRTATLTGKLIPGYAVGLALDGRGNFWLSDIGKLVRYSTSAKGTAKPNASITVQLSTPDGMMAANSLNVAVDSTGNIYCACVVVFQGAQAIGVSEYRLGSTGKAKLVRSFYDLNLPEVPPSSIAIDGSGTIYLASSLPNTGVYAYAAKPKSGNVHYSRRFTGPSGMMISSITTDLLGSVYVAAGSQIMVFPANAKGQTQPQRTIDDPQHLEYTTNDYGTLLNVH